MLKEQRDLARRYLDIAGTIIVALDRDGSVTLVNRKGCHILGFSDKEILGRDWFDNFLPQRQREEVRSLFHRLLSGEIGPGEYCESPVLTRRGDERIIAWRNNVLTDERGHIQGMLSSGEDISERRRAEEELKKSEARYRLLVETANEGIFVHQEGVIRFVNARCSDIIGYHAEELLFRPFSRFIHPDDRETVLRDHLDPVSTYDGTRTSSFRIIAGSGDTRSVELISLWIDWEGRPALLGFLADITDRVKAQELRLQTARLRAVAELSSGVAHNFNNLLQVLQGYAEMARVDLEQGKLSDAMADLDIVVEQARSGSRTVKGLQDFTEIHAAQELPETRIFDLSQTIDRAIELSRSWWKDRPEAEGQKVVLEKNLEQGCLVEGNESQLLEVAIGLIKNAAEALTGDGTIIVTTAVENEEVALLVRDSGIGISQENLGKVFQPFWTTKGPLAVGMGLAQSLGIVKRHRGDMSVHSEQGEGSSFAVKLPLAKKPPGEMEALVTAPAQLGLRILVVDDEPLVVDLVQKVLLRSGHTVYPALSGQQALQIFNDQQPDLVICDLVMPEVNGWQVGMAIKELCRERGIPKTPFVLITAWAGQECDSRKIQQSGVDGVVEKPINFNNVLALIGKFAGNVRV
jgi:PAS domain S-box-containing protein